MIRGFSPETGTGEPKARAQPAISVLIGARSATEASVPELKAEIWMNGMSATIVTANAVAIQEAFHPWIPGRADKRQLARDDAAKWFNRFQRTGR